MSLSKHNFSDVLSLYNGLLAKYPILTKSLTSGIIGFAGALVSSKLRVINQLLGCRVLISNTYCIQQSKTENLWKTAGPLTVYSVLFAAPVTHYFYNILQKVCGSNLVLKVLIDRLLFCPIFVFVTIYILDILQVCQVCIVWIFAPKL